MSSPFGVGVDPHDEVVDSVQDAVGSTGADRDGDAGQAGLTRVQYTILVEVDPDGVADAGGADVAEALVEIRRTGRQ